MEFTTQKFLSAIRARESIWNTQSKAYSNKGKRRQAWEEIAELFIPDWTSSSPEVNDKRIEEYIKKWKNIKDYYYRCKIKDKEGYSGIGGKRKKPSYFSELNFLDGMKELKDATPTTANVPVGKKYSHSVLIETQSTDRAQSSEDYNSNKYFLLSLLPEMDKMDEDQNLDFRVSVLNIIKDMKKKSHANQRMINDHIDLSEPILKVEYTID